MDEMGNAKTTSLAEVAKSRRMRAAQRALAAWTSIFKPKSEIVPTEKKKRKG